MADDKQKNWRDSQLRDQLGASDDDIARAEDAGVLVRKKRGGFVESDVQRFAAWLLTDKKNKGGLPASEYAGGGLLSKEQVEQLSKSAVSPELAANAKALENMVKVIAQSARANKQNMDLLIQAGRLVDIQDAQVLIESVLSDLSDELMRLPDALGFDLAKQCELERAQVDGILNRAANHLLAICRASAESMPDTLDEFSREQASRVRRKISSAKIK